MRGLATPARSGEQVVLKRNATGAFTWLLTAPGAGEGGRWSEGLFLFVLI